MKGVWEWQRDQPNTGCRSLAVVSSFPLFFLLSLGPVSTSLGCPGNGADVFIQEALGWGGGQGGRNPLTWDFHGAKEWAFCSCSRVGQSWHCPHSLGGGGPRPRLGQSQVLTELWRLRSEHLPTLFSPAACPPGSYKAKQGEGPCLPCPPNSRTTSPAASICTCHNNFYRADSDTADSACTSECLLAVPTRPSLGGPEQSLQITPACR